jgi:ribosomal protein S18 acetylase RimI-like enzyme
MRLMDKFIPLQPGYSLKVGSAGDRSLLLRFMQRTYQEVQPAGDFAHLATTVEQYFSHQTPLWLVYPEDDLQGNPQSCVGCLWMGVAVDQLSGDRCAHIFLLYVVPEHRRRGIGSALMTHAEAFAHERGDRQVGLQVFTANQAALSLYERLGYQVQSLWMVKSSQ